MQNMVIDYLKEASTPEYTFLTQEALELLERLEYPDYQDAYEQLISSEPDISVPDMVLKIDAVTKAYMNTILVNHDVQIDQDAALGILVKFVRGIVEIQEYDDFDMIKRVCESDDSAEEVFCELMSLVLIDTVEELLPYVTSVSDMLIRRLSELVKRQKPDVSIKDESNRDQYIDSLRSLFGFLGTKELKTVDLLISGFDVGFEMSVYTDVLGSSLDAMPVKQIASELMAMALISVDASKDPLQSIRALLHQLVPDGQKAMLVDVEVNRIILGIQK
jgi:hypothetical protein